MQSQSRWMAPWNMTRLLAYNADCSAGNQTENRTD